MSLSTPARYLIGVDLGTTNSVLAYIDTQAVSDVGCSIRVFDVPQLVAHGEVRSLRVLPSFLYFPTEEELSTQAVSATWNEDPPMVTGVLGREQGALVPSRQVSSAKSWLCYPGVNRRAKILPAQAEPPQPKISPVEASARYLMHLRDAWNGTIGTDAEARLEHQEIVLTVPASFDEEARELTVEAARRAGLNKITLLEEPLAVFYAWIAAHRQPHTGDPSLAQARNRETLSDGEIILICDIGGGTTDFSLVRARLVDGELQFERTAIGEHLLLGGDNFDFALARCVEEKLNGAKLSLQQRYALRRACCVAKEQLLSDSSLERTPVTILGAGRSVIGHALTVELTRDEVVKILIEGFLPISAPDETLARGRPTALRELGLPYASDPAISKHLAAFLRQASIAMNDSSGSRMVRPDAVLFNGGFCAPAVTRERIIEAITSWFGGAQRDWRPKLLNNDDVESAVARGAVYYARVRRGIGRRIKAGNARSYYVRLGSEDSLRCICVLPPGIEEGTTLPLLNCEFSVLANRPVSFMLYSSRTRHDAPGEIAELDDADVHRHAPLVSLLRYGKKMREVQLIVHLRATFTEVGTLELWCEARDTPHRWRLQFELRDEEAKAQQLDSRQPSPVPIPESEGPVTEASIESAAQLIRRNFGRSAENGISPDSLVNEMETALGLKRDSWPAWTIRKFCDVLAESTEARMKSPRHEVRWLNLSGFCLRPGFGAPGDNARAEDLRRIALTGPIFASELQCQVETLILLRRIAGGINASQQQTLYRKYAPLLGIGAGFGGKKRFRVNRQLEYEIWRLLASLEHLPANTRVLLGRQLLVKIQKQAADAILVWALGRLGARIPLYGPLHCVVGAETAGHWLKSLLDFSPWTASTTSAILLIARCTNDASRDIDHAIREKVISRLTAVGTDEDSIQLLSKYVPSEKRDAIRSFGESLPPGLKVVSSSNCLLSVPALQGSAPTLSKRA